MSGDENVQNTNDDATGINRDSVIISIGTVPVLWGNWLEPVNTAEFLPVAFNFNTSKINLNSF